MHLAQVTTKENTNVAALTLQRHGALHRGDQLQIEAETTSNYGGFKVTVRQEAATPLRLPKSSLPYFMRTRERVILDAA
jgi:hypothetical protein